jgi:hypothetical protein
MEEEFKAIRKIVNIVAKLDTPQEKLRVLRFVEDCVYHAQFPLPTLETPSKPGVSR